MNEPMFKVRNWNTEPRESDVLKKHFKATSFQNINNLTELIKKLPEQDECFFLETAKSFNAFSFVNLLIQERGCIDELFIATYSINTQFINSLQCYILEGKITKFNLLITDSIKHRMPKIYESLMAIASKNSNFNVTLKWSHKKVICARVKDDYYVIEGSGNLSDNSAIEQYLFTNCKALYGFRRNF